MKFYVHLYRELPLRREVCDFLFHNVPKRVQWPDYYALTASVRKLGYNKD